MCTLTPEHDNGMERLSKKDIKADQTFDKVLKEHVVKKNRKTLSIMIRGSQAVLSGEEEAVKLAHENMENLTVEELLESMTNTESDGDLKFMTTEKVKFPPMFAQFKGRRWTLGRARDQLLIYLNILGFGKGGSRKYKVAEDELEGWPDEHSFVEFAHPSYAKLSTINDIIESLLCFHGYGDSIETLHIEDEPESPPKANKRRRIIVENQNTLQQEANENLEEVEDENENTAELEELENDDEAEVEPALSPYEKVREMIIAERNREMELCGLKPHSQVRKEWDIEDGFNSNQ